MNEEPKDAAKDGASPVKAAADGQNHTAPSSPTTNGDVKNHVAPENGTATDGDDGTDAEDTKLDSERNEKSAYSDDESRKPSIQP